MPSMRSYVVVFAVLAMFLPVGTILAFPAYLRYFVSDLNAVASSPVTGPVTGAVISVVSNCPPLVRFAYLKWCGVWDVENHVLLMLVWNHGPQIEPQKPIAP